MLHSAVNTHDQREDLLTDLKQRKLTRVIDVGGMMNLWAKDVVTHCLDIQLCKEPGVKSFVGDICNSDGWGEVLNDVLMNDKYDYAICTHVLEDIRDPMLVCKMLSKIAVEGFIALPCKHTELTSGIECGDKPDQAIWGVRDVFKGYFHHRWIFTVRDGILWAYPKLGFLEYMTGIEWATKENKDAYWHEMSFFWKDSIPLQFFNEDFLGPNGYTYMQRYRDTIREGV